MQKGESANLLIDLTNGALNLFKQAFVSAILLDRPQSWMADNDLALGRIVEFLPHPLALILMNAEDFVAKSRLNFSERLLCCSRCNFAVPVMG